MSLLQLERATLGPKCWENFMLKFGTTDENPAHWPVLDTPDIIIVESPGPYDPFRFLYLTPGGRFLATLSWRTELAIWDLGLAPVGRQPAPQSPISSRDIDCDFYWVHPAVDGSAIRILAKKLEDGIHTCKLYDLALHTEEPELEEIAFLRFQDENETDYIAVCEDKVILVNWTIMRVWNFVRNEWAAWETHARSSQMFVKYNTVVQVTTSDIVVWTIPPLHPVQNVHVPRDEWIPEHPTTAVLEYPEGTVNASFWCQAICEWYTGSEQPIYFEITNDEANETCNKFQRFEVVIPQESESQTFIRPVLDYEIGLTDGAQYTYSQYRVCEDKIAMWWASSNRVSCMFGPQTSSSNFPAKRAVLAEMTHAGWESVSLDPISGRLVYITGEDMSQLKVHDFLPNGFARPAVISSPEQESGVERQEEAESVGDDNSHLPIVDPDGTPEGLSIAHLDLSS